MLDLSQVTFNIPVRYDTPHRKENVELIIDYLNSNFTTNIILCEEDKEKHFDYVKNCKYLFVESFNELFHRTKLLNIMAKESTTPIIVNYDCDVFMDPQNYVLSMISILEGKLDMCFPYGGPFYDMPRHYYDVIKNNKNVKMIPISDCGIMHPNSVGGAVFWNKQKFISIGMENENFIGWGLKIQSVLRELENWVLKLVDNMVYYYI
jgi:hypothetical protein